MNEKLKSYQILTKKMSQIICSICYDSFPISSFLTLSCLHSFCPDCLFSWITITIKTPSFNLQNPQIKCPLENCDKIHMLFQIKPLFSLLIIEQIDEILLKRYLQNTEDILNCPSNQCDFYGFIHENLCEDLYECSKCGNSWKNLQISSRETGFFTNFLLNRELFSLLYEEFFTKSCPKCGIYIYRTGGCLHMTCRKCEYEFCWLCKQHSKAHLSSICTSNQTMKVFLLVFYLFLAIWKFEQLDKIAWILSFIMNFLIKFVFYNGFFAFSVYLLHYVKHKDKFQINNKGNYINNKIKAVFFYICLLLCFYGTFTELIMFLIAEILIVSTGLAFGFCFNFIWGRWLYNIE